MKTQNKRLLFIKAPYYLGIVADALWAVALLLPALYGNLIGYPDFEPDFQTLQILRIAGTLMTGWTFLLIWAVRKPIERRGVALLTAFPVVFGLLLVGLTGLFNGSGVPIWIVAKTIVLFFSLIISYMLANKVKNNA